jgi:hypothetical protein
MCSLVSTNGFAEEQMAKILARDKVPVGGSGRGARQGSDARRRPRVGTAYASVITRDPAIRGFALPRGLQQVEQSLHTGSLRSS